jgi:hypothetical protein
MNDGEPGAAKDLADPKTAGSITRSDEDVGCPGLSSRTFRSLVQRLVLSHAILAVQG